MATLMVPRATSRLVRLLGAATRLVDSRSEAPRGVTERPDRQHAVAGGAISLAYSSATLKGLRQDLKDLHPTAVASVTR